MKGVYEIFTKINYERIKSSKSGGDSNVHIILMSITVRLLDC